MISVIWGLLYIFCPIPGRMWANRKDIRRHNLRCAASFITRSSTDLRTSSDHKLEVLYTQFSLRTSPVLLYYSRPQLSLHAAGSMTSFYCILMSGDSPNSLWSVANTSLYCSLTPLMFERSGGWQLQAVCVWVDQKFGWWPLLPDCLLLISLGMALTVRRTGTECVLQP